MITDVLTGRGAYRFHESQQLHSTANRLYRAVFAALKMPLLDGDAEVRCSGSEFAAGYDRFLGVDVILSFANSGRTATLQEKFLFTTWNTITVEYQNDPRAQIPGDWFTMRAQYYFCGYDPQRRGILYPWMLVNFARLMEETDRGAVIWHDRRNKRDGAKASFRYVAFEHVPTSCIVAKSGSQPNTLKLP